MNTMNIFVDLINEKTSTSYMRLNSKLPMRDNLESNVLGKFKAYGTRIENVRCFEKK